MATASRTYNTETQIIGTGGGTVTLSGTTITYSSVVDLSGKAGAVIKVYVDFDASPTDHVEVWLNPSDGTNHDGTNVYIGRMDKSVDPHYRHFEVPYSGRYFRIGLGQTGSTDSHDVACYVQTYTWTVA